MIAKHVPMKALKRSDFAGLVKYLLDTKNKNERVGCVTATNCESDPDLSHERSRAKPRSGAATQSGPGEGEQGCLLELGRAGRPPLTLDTVLPVEGWARQGGGLAQAIGRTAWHCVARSPGGRAAGPP